MLTNYQLKELRDILEKYRIYEKKIASYIKLTKHAIKDQKLNNKALKKSNNKTEVQEGKFRVKTLKRQRKNAKILNKKLHKMIHALHNAVKILQNDHFIQVWDEEINNELDELIQNITIQEGVNDKSFPSHISTDNATNATGYVREEQPNQEVKSRYKVEKFPIYKEERNNYDEILNDRTRISNKIKTIYDNNTDNKDENEYNEERFNLGNFND